MCQEDMQLFVLFKWLNFVHILAKRETKNGIKRNESENRHKPYLKFIDLHAIYDKWASNISKCIDNEIS